MLIGIGKMVKKVTESLNLLVTRLIGYTLVPGGSSYYTTTVGSNSPRFVALNNFDGSGFYSSDGITWSVSSIAFSANRKAFTYANGKFVTLPGYSFGDDGKCSYSSSDGITWIQGQQFAETNFTSVAYGVDKFVAINSGAYNDQKSVYYSTDGITWTGIDLPSGRFTYFSEIVYGNGKFVIVSVGNNDTVTSVYYSTDGITWTTQTVSGNYKTLAFGQGAGINDGRFVAVGIDSSAYSADGVNWTTATISTGNWGDIKYGEGYFVAIDNSSNAYVYSYNGVNWIQDTIPDTYYLNGLEYGNGKWVVSSSDFFSYSSNLSDWTNVDVGYNSVTNIAYAQINTLREIQVSIGNQGETGAEVLAPVTVYSVPDLKRTTIDKLIIKNKSNNNITFDLWISDPDAELTDMSTVLNDYSIGANSELDAIDWVTNPLDPFKEITILPSAVDVVEVKVYGTEADI